jgi:hypothetical protein
MRVIVILCHDLILTRLLSLKIQPRRPLGGFVIRTCIIFRLILSFQELLLELTPLSEIKLGTWQLLMEDRHNRQKHL